MVKALAARWLSKLVHIRSPVGWRLPRSSPCRDKEEEDLAGIRATEHRMIAKEK